METTFSTSSQIDNMASPPNFLKLEDLDASSPQTAVMDAQGTPTPDIVLVHSKPAKKRKSWGQELPEPKTALPPRKRAKTEDEKEQRRIERIKRNRAAAHNSRERKRQEADTLAVKLAEANAVLDAYKRIYGPLPESTILPEVKLCTTETVDTPAPSLVESQYSIDASASPATTAGDDLFEQSVIIKQEPTESTFPTTLPPTFEGIDSKAGLALFSDLTQHSAAMLCDLQCRSQSSSQASTQWWAAFFLYLMTLQLQTTSQTLVLAIWTHFPSHTARMIQASMNRLTSRSTTSSRTPLQSQSTLALAQRNAATAKLRVRQGASALVKRRFWMQACLRAKAREVALRRRHQTQTVSVGDNKALEQAGGDTDMGMGDGDNGVER